MEHLSRNLLLLAFIALLASCGNKATNRPPVAETVVVAYVTSWTDVQPDPSVMTHINYAFGHVNETFDGVRIDNPQRLRSVVALKEKVPSLQVLLSVGGWESGGFSEMATDEGRRQRFADDCARANPIATCDQCLRQMGVQCRESQSVVDFHRCAVSHAFARRNHTPWCHRH